MLKEQLSLQGNFDQLRLNCSLCFSGNHQEIECPLVSYRPSRLLLLAKLDMSRPNPRNNLFHRKEQRRAHALAVNPIPIDVSGREIFEESFAENVVTSDRVQLQNVLASSRRATPNISTPKHMQVLEAQWLHQQQHEGGEGEEDLIGKDNQQGLKQSISRLLIRTPSSRSDSQIGGVQNNLIVGQSISPVGSRGGSALVLGRNAKVVQEKFKIQLSNISNSSSGGGSRTVSDDSESIKIPARQMSDQLNQTQLQIRNQQSLSQIEEGDENIKGGDSVFHMDWRMLREMQQEAVDRLSYSYHNLTKIISIARVRSDAIEIDKLKQFLTYRVKGNATNIIEAYNSTQRQHRSRLHASLNGDFRNAKHRSYQKIVFARRMGKQVQQQLPSPPQPKQQQQLQLKQQQHPPAPQQQLEQILLAKHLKQQQQSEKL